jgi:hypothetical protein
LNGHFSAGLLCLQSSGCDLQEEGLAINHFAALPGEKIFLYELETSKVSSPIGGWEPASIEPPESSLNMTGQRRLFF